MNRLKYFPFLFIYLIFSLICVSCTCGGGNDSGDDAASVDDSTDDSQSDDDSGSADDSGDDSGADDSGDDSGDDTDDDSVDDDTGPENCVDVWDDAGPCPRGFETPDGGCITQIIGGAPGHGGMSVAVVQNGTAYVVAVKGRDLRVYKVPPSSGEFWSLCTARTIDHMADGPSARMDSNGALHIAYTDLWNDAVKYATNASGSWVIEMVDFIGPPVYFGTEVIDTGYVSIAVGPDGTPHIAYLDRVNLELRYAKRVNGSWLTETAMSSGTSLGAVGLRTTIAVDPFGHAHIACETFSGQYTYYVTNKSGSWRHWFISFGAMYSSIAADANGSAHIAFAQAVWDGWFYTHLVYGTNRSGIWLFQMADATNDNGWVPSLALDTQGTAHIAHAGVHKFNYTTNASGAWQTEIIMPSSYSVSPEISLSLDTSNLPRVAIYNEEIYGLLLAEKQDSSWTERTLDAGITGISWHPIALDSNGAAHVAFVIWNDILTYGNNKDGFWHFETVDDQSNLAFPLSLAVDSTANVHIIYYDINIYRLKYRTNAFGGWTELLFEDHVQQESAIAVGSDNRVQIVFEIYNQGLFHRTKNGDAWITSLIDTEGEHPSLALDANDAPHVSYYSTLGLRYAHLEDANWIPQTVDPALTEKTGSSIAIDINGKVHMAYTGGSEYLRTANYATNVSGQWVTESISYGGTHNLQLVSYSSPRICYGNADSENPKTFIAEKVDGTWVSKMVERTNLYLSYVINHEDQDILVYDSKAAINFSIAP